MRRIILFITALLISSTALKAQSVFEFAMKNHKDSQNFFAITSDPGVIELCRQQLELSDKKRNLHINGEIDYGNGGHNENWNWHFIPGKWTLAEASVEVCDGNPPMIEDDLSYWIDTLGQFCPWNSMVVREVTSDAGRDRQFGSKTLKIFPSPSREKLSVILPGSGSTAIEISLYNLLGNEMLSKSLQGAGLKGISLDVSKIESGLYLLIIKTPHKVFKEKVIIE